MDRAQYLRANDKNLFIPAPGLTGKLAQSRSPRERWPFSSAAADGVWSPSPPRGRAAPARRTSPR